MYGYFLHQQASVTSFSSQLSLLRAEILDIKSWMPDGNTIYTLFLATSKQYTNTQLGSLNRYDQVSLLVMIIMHASWTTELKRWSVKNWQNKWNFIKWLNCTMAISSPHNHVYMFIFVYHRVCVCVRPKPIYSTNKKICRHIKSFPIRRNTQLK